MMEGESSDNVPKNNFDSLIIEKSRLQKNLISLFVNIFKKQISKSEFIKKFIAFEQEIDNFQKISSNFIQNNPKISCDSLIFLTPENVQIFEQLKETLEEFLSQLIDPETTITQNVQMASSSETEPIFDGLPHTSRNHITNQSQADGSYQNLNSNISNNFQTQQYQKLSHHQNNQKEFKADKVAFIPNFDGNFKNFNDFYQPFQNNVDQTDLDDATKLQILKSKLDTTTRQWLDGFSTDADYELAKQTILKHFHSTFALKNEVLRNFAELNPPIHDQDLNGYRQMLTNARSSYLHLTRAGADDFTITTLTKQIKAKMSPTKLAILEDKPQHNEITFVLQYLEKVVDNLQDNSDPFLSINKTFAACGRIEQPKHHDFYQSINQGFYESNKYERPVPLSQQITKEELRSTTYLRPNYSNGQENQHKSNRFNHENQRSHQNDQKYRAHYDKNQTIPKVICSIEADNLPIEEPEIVDNPNHVSSNDQRECYSLNKENKQNLIPAVLIKANLNEQLVTIQLDPGSNVNIMSTKTCEDLKLPNFDNEVQIKATEHKFKSQKACVTKVKIGNIEKRIIFQLINDEIPILLGRDELLAFKIMIIPGENKLSAIQMIKLEQPEFEQPKKIQSKKKRSKKKSKKKKISTITIKNNEDLNIDQIDHQVPIVEQVLQINNPKPTPSKIDHEGEDKANINGHEVFCIDHCETKPSIKSENLTKSLEKKDVQSSYHKPKFVCPDQQCENDMTFVWDIEFGKMREVFLKKQKNDQLNMIREPLSDNLNPFIIPFSKVITFTGNSCNDGSQTPEIIDETWKRTDPQDQWIGIYKRLVDRRYLENFEKP